MWVRHTHGSLQRGEVVAWAQSCLMLVLNPRYIVMSSTIIIRSLSGQLEGMPRMNATKILPTLLGSTSALVILYRQHGRSEECRISIILTSFRDSFPWQCPATMRTRRFLHLCFQLCMLMSLALCILKMDSTYYCAMLMYWMQ